MVQKNEKSGMSGETSETMYTEWNKSTLTQTNTHY